jgi:hypothetical protein
VISTTDAHDLDDLVGIDVRASYKSGNELDDLAYVAARDV